MTRKHEYGRLAPLRRGLVGAVILLACAQSACAAAIPGRLTVSYDLYFNGARVAVMNEVFEMREERYRIVSESVPIGVLALIEKPARAVSSGLVTAEGLQPERFEGRRIGSGSGSVRAEFDWTAARLSYGRNGRTETTELPTGTQDRLSAMYQFMFAPPDGAPLDLAVTDGRRLTHYRYAVAPHREADTPLGRIPVVHLTRQAEADDSRSEIWLAPGHHFLPVRMVIREDNGARYEQIATRIEFRGP